MGELLFTPSLMGSDEVGVGEAVGVVLGRFGPRERERMIGCVHVTGVSWTNWMYSLSFFAILSLSLVDLLI